MTRTELQVQISQCLCRLVNDGHSKEVLSTNQWILGHFSKYCDINQYVEISFETISEFLKQKYVLMCIPDFAQHKYQYEDRC